MNNNKKHLKTGFKAPENYFNAFENNLFERLSIDRNDPKTGFKTPPSYFENFEERILERIEQPNKTKVFSLINKKQLAYISSIAAAIVISFFIVKPSELKDLNFDSIELTAFEEYITNEDLDIYSHELADIYNISTNDLDDISFVSTDEDNLLNYLSNETSSEDFYDNDL